MQEHNNGSISKVPGRVELLGLYYFWTTTHRPRTVPSLHCKYCHICPFSRRWLLWFGLCLCWRADINFQRRKRPRWRREEGEWHLPTLCLYELGQWQSARDDDSQSNLSVRPQTHGYNIVRDIGRPFVFDNTPGMDYAHSRSDACSRSWLAFIFCGYLNSRQEN